MKLKVVEKNNWEVIQKSNFNKVSQTESRTDELCELWTSEESKYYQYMLEIVQNEWEKNIEVAHDTLMKLHWVFLLSIFCINW
jgi:hypothetical protein